MALFANAVPLIQPSVLRGLSSDPWCPCTDLLVGCQAVGMGRGKRQPQLPGSWVAATAKAGTEVTWLQR